MRTSYVNGQFLPHAEAAVHIEDRGYQLSDGVYEVIAFYHRRFLDLEPHLSRLERSLRELSIAMPMSRRALTLLLHEVMARNAREHGTLYLQVTRGVARRDHGFPKDARPSLVITIYPIRTPKKEEFEKGVSVITRPDQRWGRCDIKSIALLANVLAKQQALAEGARETLLIDREGYITEGSSSNAYIVTAKGELVTHPAGKAILGGITRTDIFDVAKKHKVNLAERRFTLKEAVGAREAFISSTSINILPVVKIDGKPVGSGKPGPVTGALLEKYLAHVRAQTGFAP